ncbi:MAG TPA: NUDIX domain-containing protein [Rectinemataceae bacterium]
MPRRSIACIILKHDKVLVAKRVAGGSIGLKWEFPGGKVEEGESDAEALAREFVEEFGVSVKPLRLLGTAEFQSPSGPRTLAAWLAALPDSSRLELREHSDVAWLGEKQLEALDLADSDKRLLSLVLDELDRSASSRSRDGQE